MPVSYTHLDVYKRQVTYRFQPTGFCIGIMKLQIIEPPYTKQGNKCGKTVSYTHLDVYKRQAERIAAIKRVRLTRFKNLSARCGAFSIGTCLRISSSSWRQADVYKRQQDWFHALLSPPIIFTSFSLPR